MNTIARFACGQCPAMAAVHLFGILPLMKPTNQMSSLFAGLEKTENFQLWAEFSSYGPNQIAKLYQNSVQGGIFPLIFGWKKIFLADFRTECDLKISLAQPIWILPTGFDTTLLIGQYFSSAYIWAIAAAMLQSRATAVRLRLLLAYS